MPPGHVVDQVGQRLRDRGAGVGGQEGVQLVGGPPGVQRPADRVRGEPVDRRPALGLDVGRDREGLRQRGVQRSRGDRGQVRLQDHLVQRLGQQRGQRRRRVLAGGERRGVGGEGAASAQAEPFGLGEGPVDQPVPGGAAAQRVLPAQPLQQRGRFRDRARRQLGQLPQHGAAQLGRDRAVEPVAERGEHPVLGVPAADQRGDPGRRQPAPGQQQPALGDRLPQPLVEQRGRHPPLGGLAVGGEQPGAEGQLQPEGGLGLRQVQGGRGAAQLPDAEAAGAQHGGRFGAPQVQRLLDGPHGGERLRGCGAVGLPRVVPGRRCHGRGLRLDLPVGASAAQVQRHLARQDHVVGARGQQRAPGQQPLDGGPGLGGADPAGGRGTVRRTPHQPPQHVLDPGNRGGEQRLRPLAVRPQGGQRGDGADRVVGGGQPGVGQDVLEPPRGEPGGGLGEGRAEPGRPGGAAGGREHVAGGADQSRPVGGAPDQGLFPEHRQRCGRSGAVQQRGQHRERAVVGGDRQRLGGLQGEAVQPLQRAHHGGAGGQPGGELGEVAGHGVEQVGAGAEQRGEAVVRPGAQLLREGARRGGARCGVGAAVLPASSAAHPTQASPVLRRKAIQRGSPARELPTGRAPGRTPERGRFRCRPAPRVVPGITPGSAGTHESSALCFGAGQLGSRPGGASSWVSRATRSSTTT